MAMPVCPISAILFLVLIVVVVKIAAGLIRYGVLRWVLVGFVLLVVLSVTALVASIGQGIRYMNSGGTVHIQQHGDSVKVSPFGVEVRSRSGESVKVSPLGVEVNSRTESVRVDASSGVAAVTTEQEGLPAPAFPAETPEQPAPVQAEAPEQSAAGTPDAQPQPLLADHFDPDVYQSEGAAVRGLTSQMAKVLDRVTESRREPTVISIDGKISQPLIVEVMDILTKAYPKAKVSSRAEWPGKTDGQAVLLYVSKEPAYVWEGVSPPPDEATQVLRIDATGAAGKITRTAPFLDKLWVDNFDQFIAAHKGNWLMALSSSPATSITEAEDKAMDDAVGKLRPRVRERIGPQRIEELELLLDRQIRANLESSGMIADRFVQRFERPYGQIWQVGLLIDASSKKIAGLAGKCDRVLAVQQRTHRQTTLSIAGVVALVCVVYIFLNSVTKGYFVWSLRAAVLAIIAGGIFLVLLLGHNEPVIDGFLR